MAFDLVELKTRVDLVDLVGVDTHLRKVASTRGGEYAGPCPKCGGEDRLHVQRGPAPGEGQWRCRQCHEKWSDAIEYVRWHDGVSFREACERLGGQGMAVEGPRTQKSAGIRRPEPVFVPSEAPGDLWQARARAFVAYAQGQLWSNPQALDYLRKERGLSDNMIRAAGLGYNPVDRWDTTDRWGLPDDGKKVWIPGGWVIPCEVGGILWYVKVRRPQGEPKYLAVKGSHKAGVLYGADTLAGQADVILCEGEFDTLLLRQHVGQLAGVATLASAGDKPGAQALATLCGAMRIWAAYDLDGAGEKGAASLGQLSRRVRRLALPLQGEEGKDITDAWRRGVDLRAWALGAIGPADLGQRKTWAEHNLARLDAAPGGDPAMWALCEEYVTVCDALGCVPAVDAGELERMRWTADPRPDLVEDSPLWGRLLSLAYSIDGGDPYGMFQALHCLRCEGARLQVAQDTAVLDPGEWAPEEYVDVWGQYLAPHSGELTRLLCELATVATSKAA